MENFNFCAVLGRKSIFRLNFIYCFYLHVIKVVTNYIYLNNDVPYKN